MKAMFYENRSRFDSWNTRRLDGWQSRSDVFRATLSKGSAQKQSTIFTNKSILT